MVRLFSTDRIIPPIHPSTTHSFAACGEKRLQNVNEIYTIGYSSAPLRISGPGVTAAVPLRDVVAVANTLPQLVVDPVS